MRSFLKTVLPTIVTGLFIVAGCGKDSGIGPGKINPVGTWSINSQGSSAIIAKLKADMTFTFTIISISVTTYNSSGTYTFSGNTVILTETSCTAVGNTTVSCDSPMTGTISGNRMTLDYGTGDPLLLTRS